MTAAAWLPKKLGQCVKFLSGGTPSKARTDYWEGDIPWVSSGEMTQARLYDTPLRISADGAEAGSRLVPADTVLVVVRGMSLAKEFRVSITQREMAFNQDLKALVCKPDVDPYFLFYALYSQREHIRELATEASHGTKKLETSVLENINVLVPQDVEIQRQVVGVARTYDDLIENNRRRMALLEDAARQIFQEWFARRRFPGFEHTIVEDGVPKGWERGPLEHALVLQRGFDLPRQDREEGEVPIYGSTGINGYHSQAKVAGPGVVTGRSGTLGEVTYVPGDFWPLNTALWVKEFKRVSPFYATFLLREMNLKQFNGGASVPTLDRKTVHKAEILIPSKSLLTAFDEFARPIFQQVTNLTTQNQKLREARDLLLPRLMSGEIVV